MSNEKFREYVPGHNYPRKGQFIECLNCSNEFFGRTNQKFCDNRCKNDYHNSKRRGSDSNKMLKELMRIDKTLGLLYDVYGPEPIPESVLDHFDISYDGLNKVFTTEKFHVTGYLEFALLQSKEEGQFTIVPLKEIVETAEREFSDWLESQYSD